MTDVCQSDRFPLRLTTGRSRFVKQSLGRLTEMQLPATARRARTTMKPPRPLFEQPVGYLLARAAELRSMALTAHSVAAAVALARVAERFEGMAARRLKLPDNDGSA
jgi:hypothetical protein